MIRRFLAKIYRPLLIVLLTAFFLHGCVLRTYRVQTDALQPDFVAGDILLVGLFNPKPSSGDIVVVYPPYAGRHNPWSILKSRVPFLSGKAGDSYRFQPLLRRIVAIEGQMIEFRRHECYVDDKLIDSWPIAKPQVLPSDGFPLSGNLVKQEIPAGQFFVVAQQSGAGYPDSRMFGPVSAKQVKGKVLLRLWPLR